MARRGDLIRCTVMFEKKKEIPNGQDQFPVCFTLNGRNIIKEGEEYYISSLYPYICMTDGCSVLAKVRSWGIPYENDEDNRC